MINSETIREKLADAGLLCTVERELPHATQLRFSNGTVINIYTSGKITVQGKHTDGVEKILGLAPAS